MKLNKDMRVCDTKFCTVTFIFSKDIRSPTSYTIERFKVLTAKLLRQGYRYHKLR